MRIFLLIGLLACTAMFGGGCSGMAYSQEERHAQIARTWDIDGRQLVDDIDSALLLRPPSRMTIWHVR
jgi:hypothetical protein